MTCAEFLTYCDGNCTDNSKFNDACDTCPPDTCSEFLKTCVQNCTDNTAFEDACIKSCETPASAYILWGLLIVAVLWCCYRKKKKEAQYGQGPIVQAYPVNPPFLPQAQAYPANPPAQVQPLKVGDIYPEERLSPQDKIKRNEQARNAINGFMTHDGWLVEISSGKITGRTRGALNQPAVF